MTRRVMSRLLLTSVVMAALIGISGAALAAPPVVKTVPWVATNPLIPHDTWSGEVIHLKGPSDVQGANIRFSWDFGDGTTTPFAVVSNRYALEATHAYSGAVGTVYTARLTVQNTTTAETASKEYYVAMRNKTLSVEVNVAIDEGLWFLHKDMTRVADYGYWAHNYNTETPANLNAFFVNGHKETGSASNPYTETVQRGMRRLFTLLTPFGIANQTYPAPIGTVNPDGNGNGLAIRSPDTYPYSGGIFIDAIVASGTPDAVTTTGVANVIGRTYRDIVQDMVDGYAYGQTDTGAWMGGWGYDYNNGNSDNSVNQWAAIGFLAGESIISNGPDGIPGTADDVKWAPIPAFVRAANRNSLNNTQATTANCSATYNGAFSYTNDHCSFPWGPYGTTPAGMVQMVMDGLGRGDAQWDRTENFIRNNFCNTGNSNQAIRSYYYGLFSFTKAMLLYPGGGLQFLANQPGNGNPIDWYAAEASAGAACNGVARTLVNDQLADGNWGLHNINGYHTYFSTAWAIIMLNRTVFESGLPVAVATAVPNPAVAGQMVTFDGSSSFHQDVSRSIVKWEWDLDNNGTFETVGVTASRSFPAVGNYPVVLRVTDDSATPKTATTTVTVKVDTPPIAPTAEAGGPYDFCPNTQPWFLDGSKSINPDDGQHQVGSYPGDFIKSYAWDLDGNGVFNDATGAQPNVTAFFSGKAPGGYVIQLKVTDNTAASFPASGLGDLSSTDSAQVTIRALSDPACVCVSNLTARAKPGKAELTWTWAAGANHYHVYRSTTSGGPYLKIAEVAGGTGFYLDSGLSNGTTYYWVVRESRLDETERCQSNQASARPTLR